MPDGVFSQEELREIKELNTNLKAIKRSIDLFETNIGKLFSNTNKTTVMYHLVESTKSIADQLKKTKKDA